MNDTDGLLPSLDDLLRPSDFDLHRSLAEYSNQVSQEDLLFGPPSLILFEGPPQAEDHWRDGDAALQFPEATGTSSGDQTSPRAPDQSAAAPRQRSGSSGRAAGKVERKAEQNRRDAQYTTRTQLAVPKNVEKVMAFVLAMMGAQCSTSKA